MSEPQVLEEKTMSVKEARIWRAVLVVLGIALLVTSFTLDGDGWVWFVGPLLMGADVYMVSRLNAYIWDEDDE